MKKLLLSFSALFITCVFPAQNYNTGTHAGVDNGTGIATVNSKTFYLKESLQGCCSKYVYLEAVSRSGQVIFTKTLGSNYDFLRKIVRTKDDCLLILGSSLQACDVGGQKDFVAKIDTSGNLLFMNFVQSNWTSNYPFEITGVAACQDSSFYLISNSNLYSYSKDGLYVYTQQTGLSDMSAFMELSNGNLLIHGKSNSTLVNVIYDPLTETILTQQTVNSAIVKFAKQNNGGYFGLTSSGEVQSYNQGLVVMASSSLANSGVKAADFVSRNDSVFVVGTNTITGGPFYGILNSGFTLLHSSQPAYKKIRPAGISLSNTGHVSVLTNGASTVNQMGFATVYQFPLSGGFLSSKNIGVVSLRDVNSFIYKTVAGYYMAVPDLEATIKNYSADTVRSFYLNYYQQPLICLSVFNQLYNVTIAPGATVSVRTGTIYLYNPIAIPPAQLNNDRKLGFCFFTTLPDFKNDIDIDNDAGCDSITFKLITGIKENTLLVQQIQVYPNPFKEELNLYSEMEIQELEIYDVYGRLIRKELVGSRAYTFGDKQLSEGVYFMKLKTEKGFTTKKLVKN